MDEPQTTNTSTSNPENQPLDTAVGSPKVSPDIENKKHGLPKVLIFGGAILGGLLVFLLGFFASQVGRSGSDNVSPTPNDEHTQPTSALHEPTPTPFVSSRNYRYVGYIKEDPVSNIWIIDTQGNNQRQLTDNQTASSWYEQVNWKQYDVITFLTCVNSQTNCRLISHSLSAGTDTEEVVADNYTIQTYAFDQHGEQLAYIYTVDDGRSFIQLRRSGSTQTLKELVPSTGRSASLEDQVSVSFSPDGRHLLAIATLTQPNARQQFQTLWVFDTQTGKELFGVGDRNAMATEGTWFSNDTILIKHGTRLLRKNIQTQGEVSETSFENRYDPLISPNGTTVVFWIYPNNRHTQLGSYTFDKKQFTSHSVDFMKPAWLNNTQVVTLETRESAGPITFTPTGRLMVVNVQNNSTFELEPFGVDTFAIEPLSIP